MRFVGRGPSIFATVLLVASCATQRTPEQQEWAATFLGDLEVARETIAANHPGMVDAANPAFRDVMHVAYDEARSAAPEVIDYDSYRVALTRFTNRFQDAHLAAVFRKPFESVRHAGIKLSFDGEAFLVEDADSRYGPPDLTGSVLVACDGEPARAHFARRVLSWQGRSSVAADWYTLAPFLFVDYGPPAPEAPMRCTFSRNGKSSSVALQWRDTNDEGLSSFLMIGLDATRELSVERLDDGTVWVDLPTFAVNDEPSIARMQALIRSVEHELGPGTDWKLAVFDLRGNSGGSSSWGRQIAAHVLGAAWATAAAAWLGDGTYVEWRVSPGNVETLLGHVAQAETRHGADSDAAERARRFHRTMAEALARSETLIGNRSERSSAPPPRDSELPGRIVLVTSPSCFSACLDFLDIMRIHSGVVHAGRITGVDTVYMESWSNPLPSGLGRISYPMKVYRNRRRGNNEAYVPAVIYNGRLSDTEALRSWIRASYLHW
ncbi:MAG TPA: hypothetical protein VF701_18820 [Thermoanaerobaculia bacterium]